AEQQAGRDRGEQRPQEAAAPGEAGATRRHGAPVSTGVTNAISTPATSGMANAAARPQASAAAPMNAGANTSPERTSQVQIAIPCPAGMPGRDPAAPTITGNIED